MRELRLEKELGNISYTYYVKVGWCIYRCLSCCFVFFSEGLKYFTIKSMRLKKKKKKKGGNLDFVPQRPPARRGLKVYGTSRTGRPVAQLSLGDVPTLPTPASSLWVAPGWVRMPLTQEKPPLRTVLRAGRGLPQPAWAHTAPSRFLERNISSDSLCRKGRAGPGLPHFSSALCPLVAESWARHQWLRRAQKHELY